MPRTNRSSRTSTEPAQSSRLSRLWRNHGLSIVLFTLFLGAIVGQALFGWRDDNQDRLQHAQVQLTFGEYLHSGAFVEVTMENWESEFLQMFVYVVFTVFLYQRGSSESKNPDRPNEPEPPPTRDSPACARRNGWRRRLYENSMSIFFLACFLLTFVLHGMGGAAQYNAEQALHGEVPVSASAYIFSARFWFESLQNWQSEFLSLFAMVVASVFLRQKGSPESKPVSSPHSHTGR